MPPDKPQLDTLRIYIRLLCSKDKTEELMQKVGKLEPEKAQEIVVLFEQRRRVQLRDLNKFFR